MVNIVRVGPVSWNSPTVYTELGTISIYGIARDCYIITSRMLWRHTRLQEETWSDMSYYFVYMC